MHESMALRCEHVPETRSLFNSFKNQNSKKSGLISARSFNLTQDFTDSPNLTCHDSTD